MRAVRAQSSHAVRPDGELDPRTPAQACGGLGRVLVTGQGLNRDVAVEAGQTLELLADDGGLQRPLRGQGRVLPVTAAAAAGMRVRAGGLDAVSRRRHDVDRVGAGQMRRDLGDPGENGLPGQCVPDENDRSVLRPRHAPAAMSHVPRRQLDDLTRPVFHHECGDVVPASGRRERRSPPQNVDVARYVPVPAVPAPAHEMVLRNYDALVMPRTVASCTPGGAGCHLRAYLGRDIPSPGTRSLSWRDGRAHRDHGLRTGWVDARPHP